MLLSTVFLFTLVLAVFGGFPDNLPRREDLFKRQTTQSDPCCKSCAPIAADLAGCPPDADIFCGCDQWVATAQVCEACIYNVGFNTSFATVPGPVLELFWGWCQCQSACHSSADAIFGPTCNAGKNITCKTAIMARDGPGCECCLKGVDPWFAGFFAVWVQQAQHYVQYGTVPFPESCS